MKIIKVLPYKKWMHKSGHSASIYGAVPWTNEKNKADWSLVTQGYTWLTSLGTSGLGRAPAKTLAEAIEVANKINKGTPFQVIE